MLYGNSQTNYDWRFTLQFSRWCVEQNEEGECVKYQIEKEELDPILQKFQIITLMNT